MSHNQSASCLSKYISDYQKIIWIILFLVVNCCSRNGNGTHYSHSVIKRQTCHQLRIQWAEADNKFSWRKYPGGKNIFRYFANIAPPDVPSWTWWTRSISCHYYGLKRLNFIGNGYFKTEFLFRRAKFNLIKSPFPVSEEHFRTWISRKLEQRNEMLSMDLKDLLSAARVILLGKTCLDIWGL